MATASDILKQYSVMGQLADQRQNELRYVADTKRSELYGVAAGMLSGEGAQSATPLEADLRNLDDLQIAQQYGPEAAQQLLDAKAQGIQEYYRDRTANRSATQIISDTANAAGLGLANSALGIPALGAGVVNKDAGVWAAQQLEIINRGSRNLESAPMAQRREAFEARDALSKRDTKYLKEKGELSDLSRIGRDAIETAGNVLEDQSITGDLFGNAAGSLAAGGPISSGLKKLGKTVITQAAKRGLISEGAAVTAANIGSKAAMPATIGLMEGGGVYQQTTIEALELLKDRTDLTEDQKIQMANEAGLLSAAMQIPIAAATGLLVSKFEGNILRPQTLLGAGGNIVKEGIEEGIQSGTGQLAENIALAQDIDPNRDITDEVGGQIAMGAIGGMGSAGVVQVPGATLRTTIDAAKFTGKAVVGAATSLIDRGRAIYEANQKASPVSEETVRATTEAAMADAPVADAVMKDGINQADMTDEQKTEATQFVDKLMSTFTVSEDEAADLATMDIQASNRVDAIQQLAQKVEDSKNMEQLEEAGLSLYFMIKAVEDTANSNPEAIDTLEGEAKQYVNDYMAVVSRMPDSPKVSAALRLVQERLQQAEVAQQQVADPTTPEAQTAMKTVMAMAETAPQNVDPEAAQTILKHADAGVIRLTDGQRAALQSSISLVRAVKAVQDKMVAEGKELSEAELVTKDIIYDDINDEPSALKHMQYVLSAFRSGNMKDATFRLNDFMKFAQHMQNKLEALNTNLKGGKGGREKTVYQSLNSKTRKFMESQPKYGQAVNPYAPKSIQYAQNIAHEAEIVGSIANALATSMPTLGVAPIRLAQLDASLTGRAEDVAATYLGKKTSEAEPKVQESQKVVEETANEPVEGSQAEQVSEPATEAVVSEPVQEKTEVLQESDQSVSDETTVSSEPVSEAVETEVEAEPEPSKPVAVNVGTLFPDLATSWFKRTFRMPKQPLTKILGRGKPIDVVLESIKEDNTPEIYQRYEGLLSLADDLKSELSKNLKAFFDKRANGDIRTLLAGKMPRYNNGKVLNIVEEIDGKFQYNEELLEAALLATFQWIVAGDQYGSNWTYDTLTDFLGTDSFPDGLVEILNQGMTTTEAKLSLAKKIKSYWGLAPRSDADIAYTDGIAEAMAAEMLRAVEPVFNALAQEGEVNKRGTKKEDQIFYKFKESVYLDENNQLVDSHDPKGTSFNVFIPPILPQTIYANPNAIEEAVMVTPEQVNFIGAPPTEVAKTQLRNERVALTEDQQKAIENEQKVPHYLNMPMVEFLNSLGLDNVVKIFGAGDVVETMNPAHRKSVEGKNRTITSAFHSLQRLVQQVEYMAEDGVLDTVPVFYRYAFTRVNRMQMLGTNNPQANKLVREAILPTRSFIDLTQKQNLDKFFLGLAQALDVKVHNKKLDASIEEVTGKLTGELAPVVSLVQDWMSNQREFTDTEVDLIKSAKLSNIGLHAILEYARYTQTEDLKNYRTSMYVEADGVTNGPINAMLMMSIGWFNPQWLANAAKGGFFPGKPGWTMNDQRSSGDNDLYQATTDALDKALKDLRLKIKDENVRKQMRNMLILMDMFLGDDVIYDADTMTLKLKRGIAKNPLTITIYGSEAKGIAGNMVNALMEKIYERMSDAAAKQAADGTMSLAMALFGGPEESARKQLAKFNGAFNAMRNYVVSEQKGELYVQPKIQDPNNMQTNSVLSAQEFKNLEQNMLKLFIEPMRNAITETVGPELMAAVKVLRKAMQVQSIYAQYAFDREVSKMIAEKVKSDPDYLNKHDFLSQKDIDTIFNRISHLMPSVKTGKQNYLISGKTKHDVVGHSLGSALDDTYRTDANLEMPYDAGVAAIPFMTIGMGDGMMMQLLSLRAELDRNLKIFDGMNLSLDQLESGSLAANEAVWQTWMSNPLGEVSKAFDEFMKNADLNSLTTNEMADKNGIKINQQEALTNALFDPKERKNPKRPSVQQAMVMLQETLQAYAASADARHKAMARLNVSVDQMAAVGSPYQNEGDIDVTGMSLDEISDILNDLVEEELNKTNAEKPVSEDISKDLNKVGRLLKSGAREISFTALKNLNRILSIPADQKALLGDVLRSLSTKGYKIVFGSADQIQAYAKDKGKTVVRPEPGEKGSIVFEDKTIYLYNPSSETLVHELIHASTFEIVSDYYGGTNSDQSLRSTILHLEGLMDQFLKLEDDITEINNESRVAFINARNTINQYKNDGNMAAALNEYMAWGLSNSDLVRIQKRTTVNKLFSMISSIIEDIKKLVFGRKYVAKPANDMFTNLRFHTNVLMRLQPSSRSRFKATALYQSVAYGTNPRITEIERGFAKSIQTYLNEDPVDKPNRESKVALAISSAVQQVIDLSASWYVGSRMTMQEVTAFRMVVAALATEAQIDPNAMAKAQELYAHVIKNLTVEDLMTDPQSNDPSDRYYAQQKYDAIVGNNIAKFDEQGRSSLLPAFLGLAIVNDEFRAVLRKMEVPKSEKTAWNSLDSMLTNVGNSALDSLSDAMSGTTKTKNIQEAIDALSLHIADIADERQTFIDQASERGQGIVDGMNDRVIEFMGQLSDKGMVLAEDIRQKYQNKIGNAVASVIEMTSAIANEKNADQVGEGVMASMNKANIWNPVREIMSDIIGRMPSSADVYDMIKLVRSMVSQARQQYREQLPKIIESKFSRKITDDERTAMFKAMGKTDLAGMLSGFTKEEVLQMMQDPSLVQTHIADLEQKLEALDPRFWGKIQTKSKQLANFMNTGIPGVSLLRNAYAVANLLAEAPRNRNVTKQMIDYVDQLVSLYAFDDQSQGTKDTLAILARTEPTGVDFVLSYLKGQRAEEMRKAQANGSLENIYKGYIPSENQAGLTLIVAFDSDHADLVQQSFVRVAPYYGSDIEFGSRKRSYYFAPVSGRAMYNQGILQNVRLTASGVDIASGFTSGMMTAGRITDPKMVARIKLNRRSESVGVENLMPIFSDGEIVAYERSVDPKQLERLNASTDITKMIGIWRGRQEEENQAQNVNYALIDNLHKMYQSGSKDEYEDVFKSKDPVIQDAVKLITPETRAYIKEIFGKQFFIRKDLVKDALGYRSASVGDFWTGNSRWSPQTIENVRNLVLGIGGNRAYQVLVNGEKVLQNVVTSARVTIVVRSVIVPIANLMANAYQLIGRGVPLVDIVKGMPKKTAEITSYLESDKRLKILEAELRAAEGDVVKTRKLKTEIQAIEDSHKRLSIYPLIQAGEFSSISDNISQEDVLLHEGKWVEYIEKLVDKLPGPIKTAGKYAMVTRDTALFQGLQKAVQYGDFLGKAIIYDHLTKRKKVSREKALAQITEEFVNYDRLPGRTRGALEANGLMWFYNFKLRSAKIGISMLRNNPVHAFFAMMAPTPTMFGTVGLPIEDNVFSLAASGDLGWSLGPNQGFSSLSLNPWLNMAH